MMKKANTAIYIPNMDADKFEKICNEKGLQFVYVSVPPHGDLIDRDKLEKDIDKYVGGEESRSRFHHWVQVQHTVIPKSEEA